jgi:uncharacterized protein YndB with AHSA1/START domain
MEQITFETKIKAPKQKVWEAMLSSETYPVWTAPFHEGSYFVGDWSEGSKIQFLAEDDGKLGGMVGKIVANRPYEYISIEYLGMVVDGKEDHTSDDAKVWIGAHENYTFTEENGVTALVVELESQGMDKALADMFQGMWPVALKKLKEISEE